MSGVLVDGKALARARIDTMRTYIEERGITPRLCAVAVAPTVPTQQFLAIKERVARKCGIHMDVRTFPADVAIETIESVLAESYEQYQGTVIQLPFPEHFVMDHFFSTFPAINDPDCLGEEARALLRAHTHRVIPPVVSAIRCIADTYGVVIRGANVVVVGEGKLVGAPAALWCREMGAQVTTLIHESFDEGRLTLAEADIIILGAGSPGIVKPDMIKEGVAIFDAGTSEEGGRVVGDADPACLSRASLMTPVPGGIGPVAVAELFANMLTLQFDFFHSK